MTNTYNVSGMLNLKNQLGVYFVWWVERLNNTCLSLALTKLSIILLCVNLSFIMLIFAV